MDSLKILDKLWFEATSLEIRGWIGIYLLQMLSWIFFFGFTIFAHELFQKLGNPKKGCRKNTSTSGNCRESKVLPKWSLLQTWLKARCAVFPSWWGCWDMPMFQMSAKGEWGIKQLWYSFLQCSRCDIEILKNLFYASLFFGHFCVLMKAVWRFPLKGSWWHELKGKRLFITGRRFYPRIKPQFPMVLVDITSELPF